MDESLVIDWSREALRLSLVTGGPLLAVALAVGLLVGVGQTMTQLHEPVVGLVPRLVAVSVAVLVLLPWLVSQWAGFAGPLIESIPGLVAGGLTALGVTDPSSALTGWLLAHGAAASLALARAAGLVWTAPALAAPGLGARPRLLLAALLAAVLAPAVAARCGATLPGTLPGLASAWLAEAAIGAALGWSAALVLAGARQAGDLVAAQAGLSASALFDPEAGDDGDVSALGRLYGLIALAAFLALDGPLALVKALVESYRVLPAGGKDLLTAETAALAFGRVGEALALSVRAAAPASVALALAGVALGLLGRAAPSLQLLALAVPVRAAVGLAVVLFGLAALAATFGSAWSAWPGGFSP